MTQLTDTNDGGHRGGRSRWNWAWILALNAAFVGFSWHSRGFLRPVDLIGLSILWVAYATIFRRKRLAQGPQWVVLGLSAVVVGFLVHNMLWRNPLLYAVERQHKSYRLLAVTSLGLMIAAWLVPRKRRLSWLLAGAAICYGAYMWTQMMRSPHPVMDCWSIYSDAADNLLAGKNPYAYAYPDIYAQAGKPGFGYVLYCIYPPALPLLYAIPRAFFADIRWTIFTAMSLCLLLFGSCVSRKGEHADGGPGALVQAGAVLIFWYHGGQTFLMEQCWPECILLLVVCLALWNWRRNDVLTALALGVAISLKQTAWFCCPFLLALAIKERRWRLIALTAAVVTVIVLPFFLWGPAVLFDRLVLDLLVKPPRKESLSWAAVCLNLAPALFTPAYLASYVLYFACLWGLIQRLRRPRGRDLLLETCRWMCLALLAFFLFLKQSFFNYYYFLGGLLTFYVCLAGDRGPGSAESGEGLVDVGDGQDET